MRIRFPLSWLLASLTVTWILAPHSVKTVYAEDADIVPFYLTSVGGISRGVPSLQHNIGASGAPSTQHDRVGVAKWPTKTVKYEECKNEHPKPWPTPEQLRAHAAWADAHANQLKGLKFSDPLVKKATKEAGWLNLKCSDIRELISETKWLDFRWADLSFANLVDANLIGANLRGADLSEADLSRADLSGAILISATLEKTRMVSTNLHNADMWNVDFENVTLILEPNQIPNINSLANAENLHHVESCLPDEQGEERCYPAGIAELRAEFKRLGMWEKERQLTYAMKRAEVEEKTSFEPLINWFFIDFTAHYGMHPGRPLLFVFIFLVCLTPIYWSGITGTANSGKRIDRVVPVIYVTLLISAFGSFLCKTKWFTLEYEDVCILLGCWFFVAVPYLCGVWTKKPCDNSTIYCSESPNGIEEKTWSSYSGNNPLDKLKKALYFSLVSAFRIGWRDLSARSWITAAHPRGLKLRATGWIRFVAGIQSIASVYLIALSALTYFGHPFE